MRAQRIKAGAKKALKASRMWFFGLVSAAAFGAVAFLAPVELPVALWKLALLTVAAFLGYWIDRHLFPYARPHTLIHPHLQTAFGTATIRRAIIVAATMISIALAL